MGRCAPWSSTSPAARCAARRPRRPRARPRRGAPRGPRLRRLPHRPAHPSTASSRPAAAARPRPSDRRHRARGGRRGRASRPARASASRGSAGPCGECRYCRSGRENLCDRARFTGLDIDGGYATRAVADARYCFALPDGYDDLAAAPLLCAGLIGHRALRMTGDAERLGLYGFGASRAHRLPGRAPPGPARVRLHPRRRRRLAGVRARLGCEWAGDATGPAAGGARRGDHLRPRRRARAGGARAVAPRRRRRLRRDPHERHPVVPLRDLWGERSMRSVANLTRADAREFLDLAPRVPVRTT